MWGKKPRNHCQEQKQESKFHLLEFNYLVRERANPFTPSSLSSVWRIFNNFLRGRTVLTNKKCLPSWDRCGFRWDLGLVFSAWQSLNYRKTMRSQQQMFLWCLGQHVALWHEMSEDFWGMPLWGWGHQRSTQLPFNSSKACLCSALGCCWAPCKHNFSTSSFDAPGRGSR